MDLLRLVKTVPRPSLSLFICMRGQLVSWPAATAVNFSQHSPPTASTSRTLTDMTEIVKSSYVVDPSDEMSLIRRDNEGTEIDREYWQRVNQGRDCVVIWFIVISNFVSWLIQIFWWKCNNFIFSGWKCFECSQDVWAKQPNGWEGSKGARKVLSSYTSTVSYNDAQNISSSKIMITIITIITKKHLLLWPTN